MQETDPAATMYSVARYRKVGFAVLCVVLAVVAIVLILPFWHAIAWGVALSILVNPIHKRLSKRMNAQLAAGITTTLTLLFIVIPLLLIGLAVFGEINHVRDQLSSQAAGPGHGFSVSQTIDDANAAVQPFLKSIGFKDFDLRKIIDQGSANLMGSAPGIATGVVRGLLTFIFALLLVFFVLRDGDRLRPPAIDLLPLPPEKSAKILDTVYDTVHATFYGIVLVALMQGTILGVTFWALGLPAPLVWGMATVVLCTIPFAGAPIVWGPACLLLVAQGDWIRAIILAIIGMGVIGLVDNIFRPIIIGSRVNLHPIAVFFAIFGGIVSMGPVGILVGPVLLSVILGAIQVLREMAAVHVEVPR